MKLTVEVHEQEDGRWLATIPQLVGVSARGRNREEAVRRVRALCSRMFGDVDEIAGLVIQVLANPNPCIDHASARRDDPDWLTGMEWIGALIAMVLLVLVFGLGWWGLRFAFLRPGYY